MKTLSTTLDLQNKPVQEALKHLQDELSTYCQNTGELAERDNFLKKQKITVLEAKEYYERMSFLLTVHDIPSSLRVALEKGKLALIQAAAVELDIDIKKEEQEKATLMTKILLGIAIVVGVYAAISEGFDGIFSILDFINKFTHIPTIVMIIVPAILAVTSIALWLAFELNLVGKGLGLNIWDVKSWIHTYKEQQDLLSDCSKTLKDKLDKQFYDLSSKASTTDSELCKTAESYTDFFKLVQQDLIKKNEHVTSAKNKSPIARNIVKGIAGTVAGTMMFLLGVFLGTSLPLQCFFWAGFASIAAIPGWGLGIIAVFGLLAGAWGVYQFVFLEGKGLFNMIDKLAGDNKKIMGKYEENMETINQDMENLHHSNAALKVKTENVQHATHEDSEKDALRSENAELKLKLARYNHPASNAELYDANGLCARDNTRHTQKNKAFVASDGITYQ